MEVESLRSGFGMAGDAGRGRGDLDLVDFVEEAEDGRE